MCAQILIVDDSHPIRTLLARHCRNLGHEIVEAEDGSEAISFLAYLHPDLIITDIMMPKVSGVELIDHISKTPSLEAIPVLVITCSEDIDTITKCIERGAVDVLPKPFSPAILNARITSCLERNELRQHILELKEMETREKIAQEIIGAICHNFNQPLAVAMGCLQMQDSMRAALQEHCEYVHGKLDKQAAESVQHLSCDYFSRKKGNSREFIQHNIAENGKSLREAIEKITALVSEVKKFVRPVSEQYVGADSIVSLKQSQKHTVLVAKGDPELLAICIKKFAAEGYHVIAADNALEAKHHVRFSSPHVAIIDANMRHHDAVTDILRLKHLKEIAIPVILIAPDKNPAMEAAAKDYMGSVDAVVPKTGDGGIPLLLNTCKQLLIKPKGQPHSTRILRKTSTHAM